MMLTPRNKLLKNASGFCRGIHSNCNMIYLRQNLFSLHRQGDRVNCNIFVLFRQRCHVLQATYRHFSVDDEIN